jgi:hypothetical protein
MAIASSIVGVWNTFVDWGDTGSPIVANPFTINANGTWTYAFGGGHWVQMEGMCFFTFSQSSAAALVYAANVTRDTLCGVMGYAAAQPNPGSGVWWGTHPGAPHLAAEHTAAVEKAAQKGAHDYILGPQKK